MKPILQWSSCFAVLTAIGAVSALSFAGAESDYDPTQDALGYIAKLDVGKYDWPTWGGTPKRNNAPHGTGIPDDWDVSSGKNIKWTAALGSQTYGNPVVANGQVYVGTNNGNGYVKRFPSTVDLGCLVCFDEKTGDFLWQHSNTKLPTGRVVDWPLQGICDAPFVNGERLWYTTSRGEVVCLDTQGFRDGENDGPFKAETNENKDEADVIWVFDMMGTLGSFQHNMCSCSVALADDGILLCSTSNGVDNGHVNLPSPNAPSFFALDSASGELLWTDNSPGTNVLHGQWSSPAYAVLDGQPQALFAGGDGWLYSFDPRGDGSGKSKLLWKFDANPKASKWILGGRGTRNNIIATPVIYDGLVYVAVGQDPEHGEGVGHVWCIDPTKRGDVSPTLAVDEAGEPLEHRRLQAIFPENGEKAIPNPNSAYVWHYTTWGEGFEKEMHRSCGTVAIKDDILYIADFSGLFHCLDAKKVQHDPNEDFTLQNKATFYWNYDMFAAAWGSPLIVDGKVYIGDEDGDVAIFEHGTEKKMIREINMDNAVYSTPIVANNTLFISNKSTLFAIESDGE